MKKVRWGVLSTSRHAATSVIPAIQESARGEVYAVASRDITRAQAYADENRIPVAHGDYHALLHDPNVDVVYIPLPNSLHMEWALEAAEAGKHVLCEKPIALNAAEAQTMVTAFKNKGLILAEAFQGRFHEQGLTMRQMVREGVIGDLRLIDAGFSFTLNRSNDVRWVPELGGGSLYDVGCYPVAFARFITEREPISVTAQMHMGETGVDDRGVATLMFPDGVLAHINWGFTLPLRRYYEVTGTKGALRVNRTYNPKGEFTPEITRLDQDMDVTGVISLPANNAYVQMANEYNSAVLEQRDLMYPAEDAMAQMRVLDALYEAARTGQRVDVAP